MVLTEYGKLWDKDLEFQQTYHAVGTGEAIYANRLSHVYDLAGPSISFDTGCSGSMVGLDMACRYLLQGAIDGCFGNKPPFFLSALLNTPSM